MINRLDLHEYYEYHVRNRRYQVAAFSGISPHLKLETVTTESVQIFSLIEA